MQVEKKQNTAQASGRGYSLSWTNLRGRTHTASRNEAANEEVLSSAVANEAVVAARLCAVSHSLAGLCKVRGRHAHRYTDHGKVGVSQTAGHWLECSRRVQTASRGGRTCEQWRLGSTLWPVIHAGDTFCSAGEIELHSRWWLWRWLCC